MTGLKVKRYSPIEKKKIVEAFLQSGMTRFNFAQAWGVSSASLGIWVKSYQEQGADGLMPKPRKANDRRFGMKVPVAVQNEIIEIKKRDPSFGLKRIKDWMYRFRGVKVSTGSIRKTVQNEGLSLAIKPRKRRRSSERVRRFERAKPMQLWQSDITQFTLGPSSMRVYLTVFMDDHSRYIVGWRLQSKQTADLVLDAFTDARVRFGKPEEVLTDQGRQYFAWRGKSELERLLEKEGIKHVVSRAHHPQTLGKCERFWETVYNEFWTRAKPQDLEEARVRIKYFIDHYNHQRPHQGLNGMTPADRFFGVAAEVREIIEKTVSENSLRLSLDELPKPPAFLIGQVGDQRISFHGTSGQFYLTNENINGEEDGEFNRESNRVSVSQYAISERAGFDQEAERSAVDKISSMVASELSPDTSSGFMGPGDGGRAWTSEGESCEDIRVMDRTGNEDRGGREPEFTSDPILAVEQSGDGWSAGGIINTTEGANEKTGQWHDGERRDQHVTQEGSRA
ncbi:MAG: hypothetical protein BroJett040_19530 [Oligoflexia bacterium]|nr:MAG: hypothetical protein BroJett040_19530 [Oligoflexia bacterium]